MVLKVVTFKIDEEALEHLDRIAEKLGVSRSQVIKEAIRLYIEHLEKGEEDKKPILYREIVLRID